MRLRSTVVIQKREALAGMFFAGRVGIGGVVGHHIGICCVQFAIGSEILAP